METVISSIGFLIIASLIHHAAKKIHMPYTILLFVTGILLVPIFHLLWIGELANLQLTPELLFFVFLPVLLFEAGYNIKYQQLSRNYVTIRWLAIVWLLLSTTIIWFGGTFLLGLIWFEVPLAVMLLFGIIISSTDPVAVLAIFKHLGVPKRLALIMEGESLFNDGISVAVFLIMIEILRTQVFTGTTLSSGLLTFVIMIIWGIALGTLLGILFSYVIKHIKNNEPVEITLTMVLAHLAFLVAEYISHHVEIFNYDIKVSGVIATAYAAIIMGNYGKTKISPKVEAYMDKFWTFFAFVTNSFVFLMMGMMLHEITIPPAQIIVPALIGIFIVLVARAISIYGSVNLLNMLKAQRHIPRKRQHILFWWSLRGALWLMLVLLIPDSLTLANRPFEYSIKEFILAMTVSAIMFSLIIQGLTIKKIIKSMNLDKLYDLEVFEKIESEILVYHQIVQKISQMKDDYHISQKNYDVLKEKYIAKKNEAVLRMQVFISQQSQPDKLIKRALSLHALGIEKQYLKEMFAYNEIPEHLYHYLLAKIEKQLNRVERDIPQIRGLNKPDHLKLSSRDPVKRCISHVLTTQHSQHDCYVINRTKYIVTSKVIEWLATLRQIDFGYDMAKIDEVSSLYQAFHDKAYDEIQEIKQCNPQLVDQINSILLNKGLVKTEEHIINDLLAKEIITHKLRQYFMNEVECEVLKKY